MCIFRYSQVRFFSFVSGGNNTPLFSCADTSIHENFRLFLSSMPTKVFPVTVLQNSVKVITHAPCAIIISLQICAFHFEVAILRLLCTTNIPCMKGFDALSEKQICIPTRRNLQLHMALLYFKFCDKSFTIQQQCTGRVMVVCVSEGSQIPIAREVLVYVFDMCVCVRTCG